MRSSHGDEGQLKVIEYKHQWPEAGILKEDHRELWLQDNFSVCTSLI